MNDRVTPDYRRSLLQVRIATSPTDPVAGEEFALRVFVTNPFDVPIAGASVTADPPPQFRNLSVEARTAQRQEFEGRRDAILAFKKGDTEGVPVARLLARKVAVLLRRLINRVVAGFSSSPGLPRPKMVATNEETDLVLQGKLASTKLGAAAMRVIAHETLRHQLADAPPDQLDRELDDCREAISLLQQPEARRVIAAGVTERFTFRMRTQRKYRFRPSVHPLDIEISYDLDGEHLSQQDEFLLRVAGADSAIMAGAAIGAAGGWFARKTVKDGKTSFDTSDLAAGIGAALLGALIVAGMRRRGGSNPVISVSDLLGGLAVGFAVGYCGPEAIESLYDSNSAQNLPVNP